MIRFENTETARFEKGKIALGEIFGIHFAVRSPEIKNHPLTKTSAGKGLAPVLTGRNLKQGWIDYERCFSGYFFPQAAASSLREFYGERHIVVGHTKGGRVVAAIDDRGYPWREEMHLTAKNPGIDLEKVASYLNSEDVQKYMKTLYKEITPHLTTTQLKLLPMPESLGGRGRQDIIKI
jgi:adenine-specific DNA-methyltransferase